ncbi:MAG: leucine-rich repeat domain-containing protein, partial [Prevotella sp.]|nr:leucine-rich repeat domain-containing protein [Prevotella sp.]
MKKFRILKRLFLVCLLCAVCVGIKAQNWTGGVIELQLSVNDFNSNNLNVDFTIQGVNFHLAGGATHPKGAYATVKSVNNDAVPAYLDLSEFWIDITWKEWGAHIGPTKLSITDLANDCFANCSNLQGIYLPQAIMTIGSGVTQGCRNLTTITGDGNNVYSWTDNAIVEKSSHKLVAGCRNSTIASDVTTIGEKAFYSQGVIGQSDINIPANVKTIEWGAFADNYPQHITLNEGLENIGGAAFMYCTLLSEITIPRSVKQIGAYAFNVDIPGYETLNKVTVKWESASELPTMPDDPMFPYSRCKLYVPGNTKAIYMADPYWSKFDISKGGGGIVDPDFGNILFIGHSATAHPYIDAYWPMGGQPKTRDGVADCIQGDECRGMAATTMNTDYVGTVLRGMYGQTREQLQNNHYGYFDLVTARWAGYEKNMEFHLDELVGNNWDAFVGNCLAQNGVQGALPSQVSAALGQAKTVVVSLGENIEAGTSGYYTVFPAFMHLYGHFARHRKDVNIIQLILADGNQDDQGNSIMDWILNVAVPNFRNPAFRHEYGMEDLDDFSGTVTALDCKQETEKGKFIGDEYVLKDNGTSLYQLTNDELHSAVLWHPSDIGMYYIGKKVIEEIYKNDATKKAQALANIGDIYKINYIGNNKAVKMYSTYADNTAWDQYLNQTYGNWVQDGLVNMRVDFANYSAFKPYFKRFKASKVSDGSELPILKTDWKNSNTWAQVVFKATKGDMNFEPIFEVALGDGGSDNQTKISLFAGKANPDVTLTRNTKAGVWNTICLPFKPTA